MSELLSNIWLFATHWTKLDTFETEEELNDELELLQRQSLPTRIRQVKNKEGREELVLCETGRPRLRPLCHRLASRRDDVSLCLTPKINFDILFFAHRRAVSA